MKQRPDGPDLAAARHPADRPDREAVLMADRPETEVWSGEAFAEAARLLRKTENEPDRHDLESLAHSWIALGRALGERHVDVIYEGE